MKVSATLQIVLVRYDGSNRCYDLSKGWLRLTVRGRAKEQTKVLCRYEMHIGNIKLLDYYGGYNEVQPDAYFAAWMVLEEMKSDPCWKYPHRWGMLSC